MCVCSFQTFDLDSFWVTVHAYWVPVSAKQSIVNWRLPFTYRPVKITFEVLLQMLASFARWPCLCDSDVICGPKKVFKMFQEFPTWPIFWSSRAPLLEFENTMFRNYRCSRCHMTHFYGVGYLVTRTETAWKTKAGRWSPPLPVQRRKWVSCFLFSASTFQDGHSFSWIRKSSSCTSCS